MKKLLSLLGAIGLVATSSATVVACGGNDTNENDSVSNDLNHVVFSVKEGSTVYKNDSKVEANLTVAAAPTVNMLTADGDDTELPTLDSVIKITNGSLELADGTDLKNEDSVISAIKTALTPATKDDAAAINWDEIVITLSTNAIDLSSLEIEAPVEGSKTADFEKAVQAKIDEKISGAVITTDYTITYGGTGVTDGKLADDTFVAGTTIDIKSVKDNKETADVNEASKLLTGDVATITVTGETPATSKDFVVTGVTDNAVTVAMGATSTFTVAKATGDGGTPTINVVSGTETTATVTFTDGTVTITPVAVGTSVITISAEGYNNVEITVTVTATTPTL